MIKNNVWFTLVELIVVIAILSILWTIWFMSYLWYSQDTRNIVRTIDINSIKTSLWLFIIDSWKYPEPSNSDIVTYSWTEVWTQWTFWDSTFTNVKSINKIPTDPLSSNEYTYSISNNKIQYEIGWIIEWDDLQWLNFINDTYASWEKYVTAYVDWNYNWVVSRVNISGIDYIIALPSIISENLNSLDLESILSFKDLVYRNYWNLPHSYKSSIFNRDGIFDYNPNWLKVFDWLISDLQELNNQVILLYNIQKAYSWTVVDDKEGIIKYLVETNIDLVKPSEQIKVFACHFINYTLKYYVECWWLDFITFFVTNILHFDISNLPGSKINIAFQDTSNWDFWFWTNDWIAKYSDWVWTIYQHDPNDPNSLVHDNVTSITIDNSWNYWFGTVNWMSMFDWDNTWVTYSSDPLVSSHIQYIYTTSDWTVWIWTNWGVSTYNSSAWNDYLKTSWLSANNITTIFEDIDWHIWFWSNSKWVDEYIVTDGVWTIINHSTPELPSKTVNYIFQDITNNIWIWTDWWLAKYDWVSWEQYTVASTWWGLPGNKITYIYQDPNNIWFWTKLSWVARVTNDLSTWTNYSTSSIPTPLAWDEIKSIFLDEYWNILILSDWWMNTIDINGIITN